MIRTFLISPRAYKARDIDRFLLDSHGMENREGVYVSRMDGMVYNIQDA